MTIAEVLEDMSSIITEMASAITKLSIRLLQYGCVTEGEMAELEHILKRAEAYGSKSEDA